MTVQQKGSSTYYPQHPADGLLQQWRQSFSCVCDWQTTTVSSPLCSVSTSVSESQTATHWQKYLHCREKKQRSLSVNRHIEWTARLSEFQAAMSFETTAMKRIGRIGLWKRLVHYPAHTTSRSFHSKDQHSSRQRNNGVFALFRDGRIPLPFFSPEGKPDCDDSATLPEALIWLSSGSRLLDFPVECLSWERARFLLLSRYFCPFLLLLAKTNRNQKNFWSVLEWESLEHSDYTSSRFSTDVVSLCDIQSIYGWRHVHHVFVSREKFLLLKEMSTQVCFSAGDVPLDVTHDW